MGYWAYGSGYAILKDSIDMDELRQKLDNTIDEQYSHIEYGIDDTYMKIRFQENDTHWHEETTMEILNTLIPYITEGCAEYNGEDDCPWRYILINGKWEKQAGMIYYTIEDMIKKLEKEGYLVTDMRLPKKE